MARITAICSQKGGVGKTTTAINLASLFGHAGLKSLLVDLDPQANATSGLSSSPIDKSLLDLLADQAFDLEHVIAKTPFKELHLLPASASAEPRGMVAQGLLGRAQELRSAFLSRSHAFEKIVLDTPPNLGEIPELALRIADSVIIPVQCEYFSMEGLGRMVEFVDGVGRSRGKKLAIDGILLTMFDEESASSAEIASKIAGQYPNEVFRTIVPWDPSVVKAASRGVPAFDFDPRSRALWAFANLAREIDQNVGQ